MERLLGILKRKSWWITLAYYGNSEHRNCRYRRLVRKKAGGERFVREYAPSRDVILALGNNFHGRRARKGSKFTPCLKVWRVRCGCATDACVRAALALPCVILSAAFWALYGLAPQFSWLCGLFAVWVCAWVRVCCVRVCAREPTCACFGLRSCVRLAACACE